MTATISQFPHSDPYRIAHSDGHTYVHSRDLTLIHHALRTAGFEPCGFFVWLRKPDKLRSIVSYNFWLGEWFALIR